MLQVNLDSRPTVEDVHAELVALAADRNINLKAPIVVSMCGPGCIVFCIRHG